jgi:hypothetical protein
MRKTSHGVLGAFCLALLLAPAVSVAQTTGSIRGVVLAESTPLPGVLVEARSPALQGVKTATSDADGSFVLTLLPPGTYTVTAALQGFGKQTQTVPLALNATASIRFALLPAKTAEVTVTADAGAVETTSNTIGRALTDDAFKALPTGRNYASVAQLNSGVNTDGSDARNTSITVYGSTGLENTYLVDGVNTTEVEYGGQGKVLNFEFIQEVELKSGGYEAEYGHALGGILNVVTKSGGNEFHGDAFGYLDRDSLQASSKHGEVVTAQGVQNGFRKSDYGLDLGGFLMKDRLWFFAAYDRVDNSQDLGITTGPDAGTSTNVKTKSDLYSFKLTGRLSDQHTIIGTLFGDPSRDEGALAPVIGPSTTYLGTNDIGGTDFALRYQGTFGTKFLATAQFGRHHQKTEVVPGPGGDAIGYQAPCGTLLDLGLLASCGPGDDALDVVAAAGGLAGVNGDGKYDRKTFDRYDYRMDGTYLLGNHDIKVGFEFERIKADVFRNYSGGQLVQIQPGPDGDAAHPYTYYHLFFAGNNDLTAPQIAPVVATPNHDVISAFLQDSFRVRPNLTINAGLRYERQLIRGLDDITYIDITHVSPRIGLAWDFLNDGKTKLAASYGQFVEAVPLDMNIRSLNGERDATTINFDPVSIVPDFSVCTDDAGCAIKGTAVNDVDPNLKPEYMDEFQLGLEREVAKNWTVGVRGIYRRLRQVIEDTYVPSDTNYAFVNPGETNQACYQGVCQDIVGLPKASRIFKGIELTAQKRLSDRWMVYASYLYSRLQGNFDGSFRAIGGFNAKDPNITDDFDYPEFLVNADGPLTLDRTHQVKVQGAYVFPFGLTASLSGYYESGTPLSKIGWWDGYGGPELFLAPRGSEGRSPSLYEIDAHLDYALKIQPVTIHILFDAFNLLNRQEATSIDQVWAFAQSDNETNCQDPNAPQPNSCNPNYGKPNAFQRPRSLRLGLRVSF